MKKKVVSVLMAAAMVAGMAGCGSSNTGNAGTTNSNASTNNEATTESGDASASTATDSDVEKPEEITIMVDGTVFTQENGQAEFIAKLEDLLGMKINVIQPDHDAYYDVVGQTVASGDWPDVMILSSTYYAGYAEQGVLWDMTDAYASSDLKTRQDAYGSTGVIDGVRLDGKLYGMPAARGNGCVTYVKKAWLDNCGLDVPTNYDEYLAMLEAFTTGDPDGNGVNGDTYGVSAAGFIGTEAPYTNYLPEFYQDANPSFYKAEDGTWKDRYTEDSMKSALERMAAAYKERLIDPTTLTNGTSDCRNKFYDDSFGVFTYWAGTWATNLKTNLEANGLDSELVAIPPIEELGAYTERVAPAWCITEACSNPEGVYKYFIESMLDGGDMQFLWTYGVEGVHWSTAAEEVCGVTYEEGQFHMLENREKEGTVYTKNHIDPMLAVAPLENDPKADAVAEEAKVSAETFQEHSKMAQLVVSTDEMAEYNGDLTTLKNEVIAKVVTQGMSVEDGMAYFDQQGGNNWSQKIVDSLNN